MNVLLVTPWLHPSPKGGGLERYAWHVAAGLARGGDAVTLLGHADAEVDEVVDGVRRVGVRPRARLSNAPLSLAVRGAARRLARGADVVNVHTPVPGTAELAAAASGVPVVVTYHAGTLASESRLLKPAARLHRVTFERAMIRRAAGRIAVSRYVADHVFAGLPATIVMPGVDADRFSPGGAPVPGRILYVGPASRAYAWKGLATLVEALDRLPEATLRIVGDGDLAAEAARHPRVEVAGRVDDARLVDEYRAASVVALPSLTPAESFGMVLAEANACGRPVVGSRVGGIPCFVTDGENGLLAEPGDAASLAAALGRVLEDGSLARKLGAAGREKVLRDHRWEDVARRTRAVFAQAATQSDRTDPGLPSPAFR